MADEGLADAVRRRLAARGTAPTPAAVAEAVRAERPALTEARQCELARLVGSELAGAGPLEPLLRAPGVTDVLVNGPGEVWVDRGTGLERARGVRFADAAEVRRLAQRLAAAAGRRLDDAQPWVDARLPDGTRLHAVLAPVAVGSTCLSLRVLRARPFTVGELMAAGAVSAQGAELLRAVVRAGLSFLVTGGTGVGKSTLLGTLLGLVPARERLVLVEDTAELTVDHRHVVRLECRPANQEGAGRVELGELLRQALRMRPDRLVVGEVRGAEVLALLGALNTGHAGCGTLHANAARDVPARLEALAAAAGLERAALHSQLAAALDAVVHVARGADGVRRVEGVHVLVRGTGPVAAVQAARLTRGGVRPGPGWTRLARRVGLPSAGGHGPADADLDVDMTPEGSWT
ncbi:hypothetical protein BIV57_08705 [Mangrovactinospora gilvigrisea]|uniref:Bacterial type II secretion system protein E domain-containing protein n=2 Tax=Mangrovactinospora gilvigrisea TaxID=1428644 RepID=A0A1J7BGR2_9ACTN|nr:TadA family conjugal transfer-associated ATPase [Mangrovactinospora gilvigrisea]OIV37871.1 hypothetical protein BIV57_08705 [Mangrovactinospora gilvigrisea]